MVSRSRYVKSTHSGRSKVGSGAAFGLGGVARQFDPVDGEHLPRPWQSPMNSTWVKMLVMSSPRQITKPAMVVKCGVLSPDKAMKVTCSRQARWMRLETAYERGWSKLKNGELLDAADRENFAVLITSDSNLKYQQNLESRRVAVVVLSSPSWPRIQRALGSIVRAVDRASVGSYTEVHVP